MTIDQLITVDLVTAEGDSVRASETENPDRYHFRSCDVVERSDDVIDVMVDHGRRIERLKAIKRAYDPTNFFRLNQNIPPD